MSEYELTPNGWHWKITPEQIEKIKERDRDTVNKVYFDNYDKFKAMAIKYCRKKGKRYLWEDCVQQVYADMLDYDYTDCKTLFWSIRHSFFRAIGSIRVPIESLDAPLFEDGTSLYDFLPTYDIADEQERNDKERHALDLIAEQTHLNSNSKDILTAYALNCLAYRGLFEYEYGKTCTA